MSKRKRVTAAPPRDRFCSSFGAWSFLALAMVSAVAVTIAEPHKCVKLSCLVIQPTPFLPGGFGGAFISQPKTSSYATMATHGGPRFPLSPKSPGASSPLADFHSVPSARLELRMALVPIPVPTLSALLRTNALPTASQYSAYWGRTSREKYAGIFESATVTILGTFGAYFLSFVLGQFIATIVGFLFAAWTILSPELKAYQRNWELRGGRDLVDPWEDDGYNENDYGERLGEDERGLYGAYYFGRVVYAVVVEDANALGEEEYDLSEFQDYTMETDELEALTGLPYQLRLRVSDRSGRELQVHARMSEEYLDILPGMPVATVLLSTSRRFRTLAGMTDFCVPDAQCWVGDYPYLDRSEFERVIGGNGANGAGGRLWDLLQDEREGGVHVYNEGEYR